LPTSTPIPTRRLAHGNSDPDAPSVAPTLAPAPDVRVSFTAEDWVGGYYRGDSQTYGRPWRQSTAPERVSTSDSRLHPRRDTRQAGDSQHYWLR
jgi:hypothetical protein